MYIASAQMEMANPSSAIAETARATERRIDSQHSHTAPRNKSTALTKLSKPWARWVSQASANNII